MLLDKGGSLEVVQLWLVFDFPNFIPRPVIFEFE